MTTTAMKTRCPECKSEHFGLGSDEPVTVDGWYGDNRFEWGAYAGVRMVKLTARRCGDCGHVVPVDPDWD